MDPETEEYSSLNTRLTNVFRNNYVSNRGGVSYRYNVMRKYNLMAGINYQHAQLSSDQDFPLDWSVKRSFQNILPNASLNYRFSQGENLRIIYRTSTNAPSISQLQNVVDNNNPVSDDLIFFPQYLQRAGFQTAFVGKWHMGNDASPRPGYDHWVSFRGQGVYENPTLNLNGVQRKIGGYTTDVLTDEALSWLRTQTATAAEKPFFLVLSHKAVHSDFVPAARHRGRIHRHRLRDRDRRCTRTRGHAPAPARHLLRALLDRRQLPGGYGAPRAGPEDRQRPGDDRRDGGRTAEGQARHGGGARGVEGGDGLRTDRLHRRPLLFLAEGRRRAAPDLRAGCGGLARGAHPPAHWLAANARGRRCPGRRACPWWTRSMNSWIRC